MKEHYNSPDRFSPPWIDCGKHQTRTSGLRQLWALPPGNGSIYWLCSVAGEGSTSGDTKEEALERGKNW